MDWKRTIPACLGSVLSLAVAHGEIMVQVGNHELLPDTADQKIEIFVTGDEQTAGVNLRLKINDGESGPVITDIDLETGTIFGDASPISFIAPPGVPSSIVEAGVLAGIGDVLADGLLATITVSTEGVEPGSYSLILNPPELGATEILNTDAIPAAIEAVELDDQGRIEISAQNGGVPEPSGFVILATLGLAHLWQTSRVRPATAARIG